MDLTELRKLSTKEKLEIVEVLWTDIVESGEDFDPPAWHEQVLRETEAEYRAGKIEVLSLEDVKKEFQRRTK